MRTCALLCLALVAALPIYAAESCKVIHGRAHLYCTDGQLRIWHIGTHHEYEPDEASWPTVEKWLDAGIKDPDPRDAGCPARVFLYADFLICPTGPFKKGAVQRATVKSASHRHYVRTHDGKGTAPPSGSTNTSPS